MYVCTCARLGNGREGGVEKGEVSSLKAQVYRLESSERERKAMALNRARENDV